MSHRPTGFYLHEASARHDTGWRHPEHQGRLRALASRVHDEMLDLHERVVQRDAPEADEDDLLRVHTAEHVAGVRKAVEEARRADGIVSLDTDTRVSAASWDAAVGSSGALIAACRAVATGELANAFVAARPPGHHATPDRAMGFCLFNHVAVAARRLQADGDAERVAIVDWDVHHGNGTQDVFEADASVFYLSLHQSPHYPGTGSADETGVGEGEGTLLNVPLPPGTDADVWMESFREALADVRGRFEPDFVLVSAGFDVLDGDPLGGQRLEPADLHGVTRRLMEWADEACGGRLAVTLEGGYVPDRLGEGAVQVIRALAGLEAG